MSDLFKGESESKQHLYDNICKHTRIQREWERGSCALLLSRSGRRAGAAFSSCFLLVFSFSSPFFFSAYSAWNKSSSFTTLRERAQEKIWFSHYVTRTELLIKFCTSSEQVSNYKRFLIYCFLDFSRKNLSPTPSKIFLSAFCSDCKIRPYWNGKKGAKN